MTPAPEALVSRPFRARFAIPGSLLARISIDVTLILGGALALLRFLNVHPWTLPILDLHAYWESRDVINYAAYTPYQIGAFIYSPAFAQLIAPIAALSWPAFAGVWTLILLAAYVWLAGRWSLPLLFTLAVPLELYLGQIDILLAAAIVIGFRYPAAWAFPLLTKIAPGIGLLWFAFRREWRSLGLALATTVGVAAVSAIFMPELWRAWFAFLVRSVTTSGAVDGAYLAIPLWLRLPVAVGTIAWGARTDRKWTVPVAVLLAMPILWMNVFTLLLAVVPLHPRFGLTPARAWLLGVPWRAPKLVPIRSGVRRQV